MKELIEKLEELQSLLTQGGDTYYVDQIQEAISNGEESIWQYLCSNELWGGAGSIADQAVLENKSVRKKLEHILIEIGRFQQSVGRVNVRTEMWVSAFSASK